VLLLPLITCFTLVFFFRKKDQGTPEPLKALWAMAALGASALIGSSIIENIVIPGTWLPNDGQSNPPIIVLLIGCLLVGVVEELAKFIPVALFVRKKPYFNELADGIIYFGIAALVFGALEDFMYGVDQGASVVLLRELTGPFLHVGFTVLGGIAFARYKIIKSHFHAVVIALIIAILLHALFDFGLASGSGWMVFLSLVISIVLNIGIFKRFKNAQELDGIITSRLTVTRQPLPIPVFNQAQTPPPPNSQPNTPATPDK
jgi:RsiW-degrading membrane proteinase PrsW (M82 family)